MQQAKSLLHRCSAVTTHAFFLGAVCPHLPHRHGPGGVARFIDSCYQLSLEEGLFQSARAHGVLSWKHTKVVPGLWYYRFTGQIWGYWRFTQGGRVLYRHLRRCLSGLCPGLVSRESLAGICAHLRRIPHVYSDSNAMAQEPPTCRLLSAAQHMIRTATPPTGCLCEEEARAQVSCLTACTAEVLILTKICRAVHRTRSDGAVRTDAVLDRLNVFAANRAIGSRP